MAYPASRAGCVPSLPADHTFVVQFRASSDVGAGGSGRAEHLVSGAASSFASWAELQRFVEQVLDEPHAAGHTH